MKNLAALAIALALILPVSAGAVPGMRHTRLPDAAFEYRLNFPKSDTDDSPAVSVRGMCSVTFVVAGSDAVSLYLIPSDSTAATSGTLIKSFTASTTAATTFQSGAMWVKAVATTADEGGSIMRIHCSNEQVASTGEACTTAGLVPYVGDLGGYKCEPELSYTEADNELNVGKLLVDAVAGKNVISMEANSDYDGPDPAANDGLLYWLTDTPAPRLAIETLDILNAPIFPVIATDNYYTEVLPWGVTFTDVDAEYENLGTAGVEQPVRFCMDKVGLPAQTITTAGHTHTQGVDSAADTEAATDSSTDTITIPLAGSKNCSEGATATRSQWVYDLPGDPFIKDIWCKSSSPLNTLWATGDEVGLRLAVFNGPEADEYNMEVAAFTYGFDEIDAAYPVAGVSSNRFLFATVDAYASSFFTGPFDPGDISQVSIRLTITNMTRAAASSWNLLRLECGAGVELRR